MLILLAEDDDMIASGLKYALTREGYEVICCGNVASASEAIGREALSLGVLDLGLPDGSGFNLCEMLRGKGVPVIFLTAVDDEANTVRGLEMGADDYVAKPFRLRELLARINAVLRRRGEGSSPVIEIGPDIQINVRQAKAYRNGRELELTALEYRLLLTLAENRGQTLSRSRLLEGIWDAAGSFVEDNTLTVYVRRLREKLEDDGEQPQVIKTVRGMGYRLD